MAFVALDFETTGLSPSKHRIVEIGAVAFNRDGQVLGEFHSLVNPNGLITATDIHGISDIDVIDAPDFGSLLPAFADFVTGHVLVAHNAAFDISFLKCELDRVGVQMSRVGALCTLDLVTRTHPRAPRKLAMCCEALGVPVLAGHHALHDARMTARLGVILFREAGLLDEVEPIQIRIPRTLAVNARPPLAREAVFREASENGAFLSSLLAQLPPQQTGSGSPNRLKYMEALEGALVDGEVSESEADDLFELAQVCSLTSEEVFALHREFFHSVCTVALADHYVSARERAYLKKVGLILGITDWEDFLDSPKRVSVWKPGDPIREEENLETSTAADFTSAEAATNFSDPKIASLLSGMRIVLTGVFSAFSREAGREAITRRGGLAPEGLSKITDALVAGEGAGPSKLEKASTLGIPILNESEFRQLLQSGNLPRR